MVLACLSGCTFKKELQRTYYVESWETPDSYSYSVSPEINQKNDTQFYIEPNTTKYKTGIELKKFYNQKYIREWYKFRDHYFSLHIHTPIICPLYFVLVDWWKLLFTGEPSTRSQCFGIVYHDDIGDREYFKEEPTGKERTNSRAIDFTGYVYFELIPTSAKKFVYISSERNFEIDLFEVFGQDTDYSGIREVEVTIEHDSGEKYQSRFEVNPDVLIALSSGIPIESVDLNFIESVRSRSIKQHIEHIKSLKRQSQLSDLLQYCDLVYGLDLELLDHEEFYVLYATTAYKLSKFKTSNATKILNDYFRRFPDGNYNNLLSELRSSVGD